PLPTMFRYLDALLLQCRHLHDKPPQPDLICPICSYAWDKPPIRSTFLPLTPCGHWVHYRCLIWRASANHSDRARCLTCGVVLFEWEGISMLTLATRTGLLPIENPALQRNYFDNDANMIVTNTREAYEADCAVIENTIYTCFNEEYVRTDVLAELHRRERPRAMWLKYHTDEGLVLWEMLVSIKLKRFIEENCGWVMGTDGWKQFEEG
ncbi:uncharacterized protein EI97DRAFT_355657, partial [Westerdykella ornata]